jgi:hypothetical protein
VVGWYLVGGRLVLDWWSVGTWLVVGWYLIGGRLVLDWWLVGTPLVVGLLPNPQFRRIPQIKTLYNTLHKFVAILPQALPTVPSLWEKTTARAKAN